MFNDIWIARKSALSLARSLMAVTMVIAVGTQYAVITAEDHDSSLTIVNEYDPFALRPQGACGPPSLPSLSRAAPGIEPAPAPLRAATGTCARSRVSNVASSTPCRTRAEPKSRIARAMRRRGRPVRRLIALELR